MTSEAADTRRALTAMAPIPVTRPGGQCMLSWNTGDRALAAARRARDDASGAAIGAPSAA
jgi:hypothetical protein